MISLDTNILVRALMMDDPAQSQSARNLMESLTPQQPGFVSLVTLAELAGVLKRLYRQSREQIGMVVELLLSSAELRLEQADLVLDALRLFREANVELQDCLIQRAGVAAGCEYTITFDRDAAKALGMRLLS